MRVFALVSALLLLVAAGCGRHEESPDHQAEWRDVLRHKQAAARPSATAAEKQAYADSVHAFLEKHPSHGRARDVWQRLQLEFAEELVALGRHRDAIRVYRAVVQHDPTSEAARTGLQQSVDRLAVSRDKLLTIEKGMAPRQVAEVLGRPIPGWQVKNRRPGATIEAWYYQTRSGSIAAVFFRNGRVFAAEESSNSRLGRLSS